MFKVGDKAKGFKFDGDAYPLIGWADEMGDVVGVVGEVSYVGGESYSVHFKDSDVDWGYPKDSWYLAKVEETVSFDVGEDVSFKVGDKVKFKKSSIDSGMIDATEDDVFNISHVAPSKRDVWIEEHLGWWSTEHLEHVKEEIMNNTEEQEIKWEVGQEVFCLLRGKGVVECVGENEGTPYVVGVDFGYTFDNYTIDGKIMDDHKARVLFFSEPKIEAEKFPPKKPFVPTLKNGDMVFVKHKNLYKECYTLEVDYEGKDAVWFKNENDGYLKSAWNFFKIGEEIIFD